MKRIYFLGIILGALAPIVNAQNYPDTVVSRGYVFTKTNDWDMSNPIEDFGFGDWTFETNLCEFDSNYGRFENGSLNLVIEKKKAANKGQYPDKPYWGAEYWSYNQFLYGRFVNRMKPNTPSGVITSFFLNHIDWNNDYTKALEWYEIDIEFVGNNQKVQFTLHWIKDGKKFMQEEIVTLPYNIISQAHDWIIEWTPTYISYFVDTTHLFTFSDSLLLAEQAHPQNIRMNCWVSDSKEWAGNFSESSLPVSTSYDHLVYYELKGKANSISKPQEVPVLGLFPNPVQHQINIANQNWQNAECVLYNSMGQLVKTVKFLNGTALIGELKEGIYLAVLTLPNGVSTAQKFQKQ